MKMISQETIKKLRVGDIIEIKDIFGVRRVLINNITALDTIRTGATSKAIEIVRVYDKDGNILWQTI